MAKFFLLFFLTTSLLTGCKKSKPDSIFVDLVFTKAEAPPAATLAEGITADIHCYGPDLCHKFSHFDIRESSPFHYDIFAKATFPNKPVACATAIYKVDTSLTIRPAAKGQYILRFYNILSSSAPMISDTVQVN